MEPTCTNLPASRYQPIACGKVWLAFTVLLSSIAIQAQTLAPGVSLIPVGPGYTRLNSGSFQRSSVVSLSSTQYIAFYGVDTNVVVGRHTLGSTNWELHATSFLPNSFTDGHCVISIGIGADNILHCSWGMHGNPFNYARSPQPESLNLVAATMTGFEDQVTYPQFINLPNGDLLFLFRQYGSGNGDTYLNRWSSTTHSWINVNYSGGQQPFIKGRNSNPALTANAYPNFATVDSSGTLHLTWTWRDDAASIGANHDQCYARSSDYGVTWKKWNGTPYTLPITKSSAEVIYPIPLNSDLMNQCGQCLDTNERPVIATWWAPGGNGTPIQYSVIWNDGAQWRTNQVGTRTTTSWPGRPIIVCDSSNRLFMVFSDSERGRTPTLAWTDDPNRAVWHFTDLTDDNMGGWEPAYDPARWKRDGILDVFYQPLGTASAAQISVLEFDPAVFLANPTLPPVTYEWPGSNGLGVWSSAANWTNASAPAAGGSNNLGLIFNGSSSYTASNDLPGAFRLNSILLNSAASAGNVIGGNPLAFVANGAVLPALEQYNSAEFDIAAPIILSNQLNVSAISSYKVTLSANVTGPGGLRLSGSGTLALAGTNTFAGGVSLVGGTLFFGDGGLGLGDVAASGGMFRWQSGSIYDFTARRAVSLNGATALDPNGNLVTLSGPIAGIGGPVMQAGSGGTVVLAAANTYTGNTTINAGTLVAAANGALGGSGGGTYVTGGTATSSLGLQGNITLAEPISCGARQPLPNASALAAHVINLSGTNTLTGPVTATTGGNQDNIESAAGLLVVAGDYSQSSGTGTRYLNLQGAGDAHWTGNINDGTAIVTVTKRGTGRWILSGANGYTGSTTVTDGSLLVDGTLGAGGVTVSGGTFGGNGVVNSSVTVRSGGTLAPGASIGALTVNGNVTLSGATLMEISTSPRTNDLLQTTGTLTYGGSLTVTNLAGALVAGDSFQLFSSSSHSGTFTTTNLPALAPGLSWNFDAAQGTLEVLPPALNPTHITASLDGTTLTLSWPEDHLGWRLMAQTNSLSNGLSANWVEVPASAATNRMLFDLDKGEGSVFFRLVYP